ncbi:MAG: GNAT family N-acetyltransferase [Alphaproteobacteria bacterium]|nr:GNAT family N-acetyltransferase [Alphaproteobacteria bacterium]
MQQVRDAEPGDYEALVQLNNAAIPAVNALTVAAFADFAAQADLFRVIGPVGAAEGLLIALQPGRGYESQNYRWFERAYSSFLYVDRVVVSETRRGGGLGALLYKDFAAAGERLGVPLLACEVNLDPPNPGSIRFHERLGFRPVGTQQAGGKLVQLMIREVAG